jgi:hypothetical protein
MEYKELKQKIDEEYPIKIQELEIYLENHWKEFNQNKSKLEKCVGNEFKKIIKEINLHGAEILDFNINYNPQFKQLEMKITQLKLPDGKIMDDKKISSQHGCPHFYLNEVIGFLNEINPEIKEFQNKYNIRYIQNPDNNCEHK